MDLEVNILGWSLVFWGVALVGLWKVEIGDGWSLGMKIFLSVVTLPLFYFITNLSSGNN